MTYEEFRKAHPATREFHRHSSEQRANLAASHRLTPRQRSAVGEFFYTHPMLPGVAFRTAKLATTAAYKAFMARARIEVVEEPTRVRIVVDDAAVAVEEAAEIEASTSEVRDLMGVS